jgi:hypothetical protein
MKNIKQLVELYDPHPGFSGAVVPLPKQLKKVADSLNGKRIVLEDVLKMITHEAEKEGGSVNLVDDYNYIKYSYKQDTGKQHHFRLLRYKYV